MDEVGRLFQDLFEALHHNLSKVLRLLCAERIFRIVGDAARHKNKLSKLLAPIQNQKKRRGMDVPT